MSVTLHILTLVFCWRFGRVKTQTSFSPLDGTLTLRNVLVSSANSTSGLETLCITFSLLALFSRYIFPEQMLEVRHKFCVHVFAELRETYC